MGIFIKLWFLKSVYQAFSFSIQGAEISACQWNSYYHASSIHVTVTVLHIILISFSPFEINCNTFINLKKSIKIIFNLSFHNIHPAAKQKFNPSWANLVAHATNWGLFTYFLGWNNLSWNTKASGVCLFIIRTNALTIPLFKHKTFFIEHTATNINYP